MADTSQKKDPNKDAPEDKGALWHLDTDISQMEGIVDRKGQPMTPPVQSDVYTGWPPEQPQHG